jgi:hypothetical protein
MRRMVLERPMTEFLTQPAGYRSILQEPSQKSALIGLRRLEAQNPLTAAPKPTKQSSGRKSGMRSSGGETATGEAKTFGFVATGS